MKAKQPAWDESNFPPEVRQLGRPLHTHGPAALLRAVDRFTEATQFHLRLNSARIERIIYWVGAVFFLALVPLFLVMYFFDLITGGPREIALGVAGFGLLAGGASLVLALRSRRSTNSGGDFEVRGGLRPTGGRRRSYFVFRDALAVVQGDEWTVVNWDDVEELQSPRITGSSYQLVTRQGAEVPIDQWVEDYATLIQTVVDQVNEVLVPPALASLAAGKQLTFGPFGVSRRSLTYKGKKLRWQDVTSMVLLVGSGERRLTIRRRWGLFAWCWYDINRIPNHDVFYHVLCQTAPPRLLKRR
jgi:hypothetical protein